MKKILDTIYINDLKVNCIIGVFENERIKKQPVIINIALSVDTQKAASSDDLNDTVSYHDIYLSVNEMVKKSKFNLIEKLAQEITNICLEDKRVEEVMVRVEKTNAVKFGKSSAIEIRRQNEK